MMLLFLVNCDGASVTSRRLIVLPGLPGPRPTDLDIALSEGPCHGGRPYRGPLGPASDKGESVKVDRWRLEVLEVQRRATTRVRLLMP